MEHKKKTETLPFQFCHKKAKNFSSTYKAGIRTLVRDESDLYRKEYYNYKELACCELLAEAVRNR